MTATKALSAKDMNAQKITNMGDGTAASDAATKGQVDTGVTTAESRANHTGTQLASTISNFDTQVRTSRLDQMAAPTAAVPLNAQKITGLADGTVATDAATKGQLDTALAGLASGQLPKGAVRVAATTAITIAAPGAAIDGVTLSNGDLFLATAQSTGSQNGPYVFNGAAVPATRATNWDTSGEAVLGSYWVVLEGTKADNFALLTNDTAITLGTTTPTFQFISVAGAAIGRFSTTCPATAGGATWTVTHNLNSQDVICVIRRTASPYDIITEVYIENATVNTCLVKPDVALALNEFTAIVKY